MPSNPFAWTSASSACGSDRVAERRFIGRRLSADLIQRADKLMYEAKGERASHIYLVRSQIVDGDLVELTDDPR